MSLTKRKVLNNHFYHICNKSIANFGIFTNNKCAYRFLIALDYYNSKNITIKLSLINYKKLDSQLLLPGDHQVVKHIAYCIMPDHYHLLIKALDADYVSKYISNVENSYTRYFNIKHNRKGPLWQSRFRLVKITTDQQLLHVSRYIHLNPTTNDLVANPEDWEYSSYKEYLYDQKVLKNYCTEISIKSAVGYQRFVENQKDYQKKLRRIKKLLLE